MLNIHPALLPAFKGLDTHRRAIEAGVEKHGATVHFVVPEMDSGPIVAQAAVPVLPDDTEAALASARARDRAPHLSDRLAPRRSGQARMVGRPLCRSTGHATPRKQPFFRAALKNPRTRPGASRNSVRQLVPRENGLAHLEIFRGCLAAIGHEFELNGLSFVQGREPCRSTAEICTNTSLSPVVGLMNP